MKSDRDYLREASSRILQNDPELAYEVAKVPPDDFNPQTYRERLQELGFDMPQPHPMNR